jgi:hypothetical protein
MKCDICGRDTKVGHTISIGTGMEKTFSNVCEECHKTHLGLGENHAVSSETACEICDKKTNKRFSVHIVFEKKKTMAMMCEECTKTNSLICGDCALRFAATGDNWFKCQKCHTYLCHDCAGTVGPKCGACMEKGARKARIVSQTKAKPKIEVGPEDCEVEDCGGDGLLHDIDTAIGMATVRYNWPAVWNKVHKSNKRFWDGCSVPYYCLKSWTWGEVNYFAVVHSTGHITVTMAPLIAIEFGGVHTFDMSVTMAGPGNLFESWWKFADANPLHTLELQVAQLRYIKWALMNQWKDPLGWFGARPEVNGLDAAKWAIEKVAKCTQVLDEMREEHNRRMDAVKNKSLVIF